MNKQEHWTKVEKDNEDIMKRMHPATLIPSISWLDGDCWMCI